MAIDRTKQVLVYGKQNHPLTVSIVRGIAAVGLKPVFRNPGLFKESELELEFGAVAVGNECRLDDLIRKSYEAQGKPVIWYDDVKAQYSTEEAEAGAFMNEAGIGTFMNEAAAHPGPGPEPEPVRETVPMTKPLIPEVFEPQDVPALPEWEPPNAPGEEHAPEPKEPKRKIPDPSRPPKKDEAFLDVADIAARWGVSVTTVRKRLKDAGVYDVRPGTKFRMHESELAKIESQGAKEAK